MNVAYFNGEKCENLNQISLYNPSFLYGINVFEGIRAYWNSEKNKMYFFDLDQHLDRLYNSADFINFSYPVTKNALQEELMRIIENENIQENIYIRITFFVDGETNWQETQNISYIVSMRTMESKILSAKSQTLCISSFRRISSAAMPPSVKAGANYLNSRYALLDAKRKGFDGAVFLSDKNCISESTGSCIFFVKGNTVITPSVNSDILVGVTRNRIIEICNNNGIEVLETEVSPASIDQYDACFLAGTMIEVQPISKFENKNYNTEENVVFQKIINKLNQYVYAQEI